MLKALFVSIFLTVGFSQLAFAQNFDPLDLLTSGDVKSVEKFYSSLQSKFDSGAATEYDLLDAYKAFYQTDDKYRVQLANWIKTFPKSPSAYLARGIYYRKLGEHKRGEQYISQTPTENLTYMEQMFKLAQSDLEISLQLNSRSYLSVLHLLNIAQFRGDTTAATKYLDLGKTILPTNFLLRARYLIQLAPRWGGSYESMDLFIRNCRSEGAPQKTIDLLNAIRLNDSGEFAQEKGMPQALTDYVNALTLSRAADRRFRQDYLGYSLRICANSNYSAQDYCR